MTGISAKRLALCFAFLAVTAPTRAEKPSVIPLATSSQWRLVNSGKLDIGAVRDRGGDPAIEKEYGVKSLERRTYTLYPEDESVEVIFESTQDVSSAYGLLTIYRTEAMTTLKDLPLTEIGRDTALMARGRVFIRVVAPRIETAAGVPAAKAERSERPREFPFSLAELRPLLLLVGGPGPPPGDLRNLPAPLPATGLIEESQKYLLGQESARRFLPSFRTDLIGFSQGAEIRLASYRSGDSRVRVLAVNYPTPQIARLRFEAMEKLLDINKERAAESIYGKRTGSYVILVLDANSAAAANRVLDQFSSSGYIMWNERYSGDKSIVMQMVELVLANLFFSFFLAGFSFVGGIIFFASKIAARKWLPNTSWGQPDEATITKLNLE